MRSDVNTLNARSIERLKGVAHDLVEVVTLACKYCEINFQVTEGLRSLERQKELFAARKSKTMNSRHLTGDAVDLHVIIDGKANWRPKYYDILDEAMQRAAMELGLGIRWGGNWDGDNDRTDQTFNDLCHWELQHEAR
jgi:peptidoglycan L-alanyl-D-glutamate endopeptidase CwlK